MTDVYPDKPVEVLDFSYESDLHLTRKIERVQARRGEDANYVLSRPYNAVVKLRRLDDGHEFDLPIDVPERFLTDLSSVPWWGRWAVSRVGPHLEASIVHDWLYVAWQQEKPNCATRERRLFADQVFRRAMEKAEVRRFRTWLIYAAVRLGGRRPFEDKDKPLFDKARP